VVGTETRDDAAVWKLDHKTGLVSTVDFFAPVVDDPRAFGAIAAANALSDVWAMGGRPLFALSIVGFPRDLAGQGPRWDVLGDILAGAAELAHTAGCPIIGGHSVDDVEPKFGLAVTGKVHPARVLTNAGARPGDLLLLTKQLGIGIAVSAIKKGTCPAPLAEAAVQQMLTLNRAAGEVLAKAWRRVHALTDVTGFGLLGHLDSMMRASGTRARLRLEELRVLEGVRALAAAGTIPGGSRANLAFVQERTTFPADLAESDRVLLADAQTNGGLLAAVEAKAAPKLLRNLADAGAEARLIGELGEAGERGPGVDLAGALMGG
jgi:selenide, water dikinase